MTSSIASPSFTPWELSEKDCADRVVLLQNCYSCSVSADDVPDCVRELHGVVMRLCRTNGNGKCGAHAKFGAPISGEIKVADERSLGLKYFGRSYCDLWAQVLAQNPLQAARNAQLLENVVSQIWPSFIQPKFEQEFGGFAVAASDERSDERVIFERELIKDSELCDVLRRGHLEKKHAEAEVDRRRELFTHRIKSYFGRRQQHLPFWYYVAVQRNLMPRNCLEQLMSADIEVQRNCSLQHRREYAFLREDEIQAQHTSTFLCLLSCEGFAMA